MKERHFTTPLTLATVARTREYTDEVSSGGGGADGRGGGSNKVRRDKDTKEKYKGGSESKGKSGHSETPDEKPICFKYNNKLQKGNGKKCRYMHVCSLRLGKHPAYECKGATRSADTQGEEPNQ